MDEADRITELARKSLTFALHTLIEFWWKFFRKLNFCYLICIKFSNLITNKFR